MKNIKKQTENLYIDELKALLDLTAQDAIISVLKKYDVRVKIVSEEGDLILGSEDFHVILDPIDGTTNFARGLRPSVTSLAVSETSKMSGMLVGVIRNLYTGDVYHAVKNKGAWCNFYPIKTAEPLSFKESLVSIDISKKPKLEITNKIIRESRHIRELGCSAMSLCYLASGSLDVHLDLRGTLRATDVAAGLLILKESGGVYAIDRECFADINLRRDTMFQLVAASCKRVLQEVLRIIK